MIRRTLTLVLSFTVVALTLPSPGFSREAPRSRTAYLNLSAVVKGYERYKRFSEEIKEAVSQADTRLKKYRREMEILTRELARLDLEVEDRKDIEKKARETQRRLEDVQVEGRDLIGRKTEEQLVHLYKDVTEVVVQYARTHDLDAVLHYNDALQDSRDYYAPQNVSRKMQAGACVPLYLAPEVDITERILKELNSRYRDSE